jgi:hypothetical protein
MSEISDLVGNFKYEMLENHHQWVEGWIWEIISYISHQPLQMGESIAMGAH